MSDWNIYFVTEDKPVRWEDAERALQAACPDFYIDADLVILRNGYPRADGGADELECAQVTVEPVADPAELEEYIEGKQSTERLRAVLDATKILAVIQLLNTHFWWDNPPERTLRPLQDWLIENFEGALYVEGGDFFDRQGLIP